MRGDWEMARLGDVITLEYGKPLPKRDRVDQGKFSAYGANGVKCRTDLYYRDRPSIVVGRKGSAGEITLTDEKFWPLDVTYFVDFDEARYDLHFLYYLLGSLDLPSLAKGVKPGINRNDVYRLEAAFPSLPEQKRIVAILDEAFTGIDAAIANTERNLANARELFESYLNRVFTEKGEEWEETTIGNIAEVKGGKRLPKGHKLEKSRTPHPYISVSDFTDNGSVRTATMGYLTPATQSEISRYTISADDLYISIAGTIGKSGIVPHDLDGANLTENACKLVFSRPVEKRFIYYFTRSRLFREQVMKRTRTTAQPKLALSRIRTISLSLPPQDYQQTLVDRLCRIAREGECLELTYRKKLASLATLRQSILRKAFAGELTAEAAEKEVAAA